MKALVCEKFAPVDALTVAELPDPTTKNDHAIVEVKAAGVNYPDGLLVQGLYQSKPTLPFVPGLELAGVVTDAGEGLNLEPGSRVIGIPKLGAFAELALVPVHGLIPLPDAIPFEEAAGLAVAHGTAHHALKQRAKLEPGERLVVLGAAGGTGLAAVQIGKARGATVIAVCSTDQKLSKAEENGADILINYRDTDLKTELRKVTDGKGVDVAYDPVGGEAFDAVSRCMAWNGRLLVIGFASGQIPNLAVNLPLVKGYSVVGVFWGAFAEKQPDIFKANMHELLGWYHQGKVKVRVDELFPLHNGVAAINRVMNRKAVGKVIITTSP